MQLSWAYRHGYLIPAKKREPEEFKSAATLLLADRGGLIFQPIDGIPRAGGGDWISSRCIPRSWWNTTSPPRPSTAVAASNTAVPELGYTICERREGIVPATLRTVVRKRGYYKKEKKRLKKLGDDRWHLYDRRQNALKWMLVTCFGYLGYKNARFGRIEAHESVNAFSRDAILRAKEIAEAQGYSFHPRHRGLHVAQESGGDRGGLRSAWRRKWASSRRHRHLARRDLQLDPLPAVQDGSALPTANRYVGWYTNNEIKIRGIEIRRRDTPVFIKRMQGEMLQIMGQARSIAGLEQMVPELLAKPREWLTVLRSGTADPLELVVRRRLIAGGGGIHQRGARTPSLPGRWKKRGSTWPPGEMVEYIILDASGKKNPEKAKPLALYSLEDGYDIEGTRRWR